MIPNTKNRNIRVWTSDLKLPFAEQNGINYQTTYNQFTIESCTDPDLLQY